MYKHTSLALENKNKSSKLKIQNAWHIQCVTRVPPCSLIVHFSTVKPIRWILFPKGKRVAEKRKTHLTPRSRNAPHSQCVCLYFVTVSPLPRAPNSISEDYGASLYWQTQKQSHILTVNFSSFCLLPPNPFHLFFSAGVGNVALRAGIIHKVRRIYSSESKADKLLYYAAYCCSYFAMQLEVRRIHSSSRYFLKKICSIIFDIGYMYNLSSPLQKGSGFE